MATPNKRKRSNRKDSLHSFEAKESKHIEELVETKTVIQESSDTTNEETSEPWSIGFDIPRSEIKIPIGANINAPLSMEVIEDLMTPEQLQEETKELVDEIGNSDADITFTYTPKMKIRFNKEEIEEFIKMETVEETLLKQVEEEVLKEQINFIEHLREENIVVTEDLLKANSDRIIKHILSNSKDKEETNRPIEQLTDISREYDTIWIEDKEETEDKEQPIENIVRPSDSVIMNLDTKEMITEFSTKEEQREWRRNREKVIK